MRFLEGKMYFQNNIILYFVLLYKTNIKQNMLSHYFMQFIVNYFINSKFNNFSLPHWQIVSSFKHEPH